MTVKVLDEMFHLLFLERKKKLVIVFRCSMTNASNVNNLYHQGLLQDLYINLFPKVAWSSI